MPTGTYEPPSRGHQVDQGQKQKIASALANQAQNPYASYNIVSAMYAGRDDRGRPIYRVVYNTTLSHPGSAGSRKTPNVTKTFTLVNGQIDSPSLSGSGTPTGGSSGGGSGSSAGEGPLISQPSSRGKATPSQGRSPDAYSESESSSTRQT